MKKFLTTLLLVMGIPLILLLGLYLWTDPFKTLHSFDMNDVDGTNREYQTVELFKRNNPMYHYNSFVFCSSQGSGLNTYTWKMYLPEDSHQFLFQAWSENITGVKQKLLWLDKQNVPIEHVLVLIDIPGFFVADQRPTNALTVKHYELSGESAWMYHAREYYNFIQRPSSWIDFAQRQLQAQKHEFSSDTITNDFFAENRLSYSTMPKQDSLCSCSEQTRRNFFNKIANVPEKNVVMAQPVITACMQNILTDIKAVFDKQKTDYYIIITPSYRYTSPYLNTDDLETLQNVFGQDRVYDFTTDVELTSDYNDFFDPVHFGTILGWKMLKKIYKQ